MKYKAFCRVRLASVYVAASHTAEQFTQLLRGDWVMVEHEDGVWCKVRSLWNGDCGWVLKGQLQEHDGVLPNLVGIASMQSRFEPLIGAWCSESDENVTALDALWHHQYLTYCEQMALPPMSFKVDQPTESVSLMAQLNQFALSFLYAPYQWGGMSIFGIDCSGLSQLFYRFRGIPLPHAASQQAQMGKVVDFMQEVCAGDLAFFADAFGEIVHVGILLSSDKIIHASATGGCVKVDAVDWQGIVNEQGERTHRLRIIRRLETIR